ncbi:bifunctional 3-deoxy-7-phosphoheptulonate synthase/chorismate mutase [Myxococcota bacterium]|jgi:3-deoxy-7-phosphoheptulonate synthase/chorismate mutase|nr:bifunctional 3-deoxy-7-phosphoheptulonate synthase/chorismate mutase [Myxococcota bacterium]
MSDTENRDVVVLRKKISDLNMKLLDLLSQRAQLVIKMAAIKRRDRLDLFSPSREREMIQALLQANRGPFSNETVVDLFKHIFDVSLQLMRGSNGSGLEITSRFDLPPITVPAGDVEFGKKPVLIAGPCSVESEEQIDQIAKDLAARGVRVLRGGTFKMRTSPYSFQGLGNEGVRFLGEAAKRYGMASITEVNAIHQLDICVKHVDMLQIGTRSMSNFELLQAAGQTGLPILLKRGFAATLEEFELAAEYIYKTGNQRIVLCERGIRTFNSETRFTLDISAVPLLKLRTRLPVTVDVSHAAGRRIIIPALARAALAAGADGLMVEVHPQPHLAHSDGKQQLDIELFDAMMVGLKPWFGD